MENKSVYQIYNQHPPKGWEAVFKSADSELRLVSQLLDQLGEYYPDKYSIFRALELCPLDQVKVVILGQDPYHEPNQANGLSFSVPRGVNVPPSLRNIFKELEAEFSQEEFEKVFQNYLEIQNQVKALYLVGTETFPNSGNSASLTNFSSSLKSAYKSIQKESNANDEQLKIFAQMNHQELRKAVSRIFPVFTTPNHGDLTSWAKQGVLLLNTCLTVKPHSPGSHKEIWNGVIGRILDAITSVNSECIFVLLGKKAQDFGLNLNNRSTKIIASHPSPFSANRSQKGVPAFIGSNIFRKINEILLKQGRTPIDWNLEVSSSGPS